ncbi:DUF6913 domain-containing protein [Nonlabens sp. SCSIO 43208]|uniref:DUF6913 domain-containing protein n=1 Tax=Nonlabens sp. SCSIO 43208 TaxID=2793009 RepID=UPI003D6BBD2D
MFFKGIKRRSLRKAIRKLKSQNRNGVPVVPKSLLVITSSASQIAYHDILRWCEQLKIDDKNLTVLNQVTDKKKLHEMDGIPFDEKSIKWNATVVDEQLVEALEKKHDLQILLIKDPDELATFVTIKAQAALKVAINDAREELYDLSINVSSNDKDVFVKEIAKYIKILTR